MRSEEERTRRFALTTAGQDRARGRLVQTAPPDPDEDDGRPISALVCKQVAESIANEYRPDQIPPFLHESGIPLDRLPLPDGAPDDVSAVLAALDQWGSEGRRILRTFLGRWLDNRLLTGPDDELRVKVLDQLARGGWFLGEERLVVGEPALGTRVSAPVLRDARLAALHPEIVAAAAPYVRSQHYASAVFESVKAVVNRVKSMTGLDSDGVPLMTRRSQHRTPDWSSAPPELRRRQTSRPAVENSSSAPCRRSATRRPTSPWLLWRSTRR
jgi:hypothetical protein